MIRLPAVVKSINKNGIASAVQTLNCIYYSKDTSSTSSSSSSDDEKKPPTTNKQKSKAALEKLNVLLNQMVNEEIPMKVKPLELAKPKPRRDIRKEEGTKEVREEPVEKKIVSAVKDVATKIGGDVKKTESELLSKLLNVTSEGKSTVKSSSMSLSDIVKGMKIERESVPPRQDPSRAEQVKKMLKHVRETRRDDGKKQMPMKKRYFKPQVVPVYEKIDLFGAEPLGIFTSAEKKSEVDVKLNTWEDLYQRDLRLATTHPPANYFQEMILWTEQGKVWKFPIDNEQGLDEEQKVYFAEHVFLEKHLDPWCPPKGPIRHFMELVCVGLSKNHYLSAQHKKEHIEWYRDYFNDKISLLTEVGAVPATSEFKTESKPANS